MQRAVALVLAVYAYYLIQSTMPRLPRRIPTHFNWSGEATGWGSPNTLWGLLAAQVLGAALILAIPAIGRRAPQLVSLGTRKLSDISPEARTRIMPLLEDMCGYLAVLYSLLFTFLVRETIRAAVSAGAGPSPWPLGGFLVGTAALLIYYLWRMNQVARENSSSGSGSDAA